MGARGEAAAAAWLARKGYAIISRNWRRYGLELDLVCEFEGQIIFVEVKTRRRASRGGGCGAITGAKKKRLVKAAQLWLLQSGLWERPCRFDVICLYARDGNYQMEHYPDAFTQTLDCSHSDWQY